MDVLNSAPVDRGGAVEAAVVDRAYEEQGEAVFIVLENPAVDNAFGVYNFEIDEWRVHPFYSRDYSVNCAVILNKTEAAQYE
jgi:hypothetical protein